VTLLHASGHRGRQAPQPQVLGTRCFCGDPAEAAAALVARVEAGRGGYACFCNVHVVVTALHDEHLRRSLDEAWLCFPDGAPVAWMQRRLGRSSARRIAGPDLLPALFALGEPLGIRHYLLGSTPEVLRRLRDRLAEAFPSALVVGSSAPDVVDGSAPAAGLVEAIRTTAPDVVWCAFGAPKQEVWMRAHHEALAPALLLGVGAAFDFHAASKRRAPSSLQTLGLEWLHRLAAEPGRLAGRYLRTNTEFVLRAPVDLLRRAPR
jgi:N-acetylglucosaminyldiphosphoundecaprenol N-acetyl-beta-D-mannosaminyltransferase